MALVRSKLTAQGQISVPAEIRRKLGIGPGSVLEWDERDEEVVVRRAGRYSSEEIHRALFPSPPAAVPAAAVPAAAVKAGIRQYLRRRHAGR